MSCFISTEELVVENLLRLKESLDFHYLEEVSSTIWKQIQEIVGQSINNQVLMKTLKDEFSSNIVRFTSSQDIDDDSISIIAMDLCRFSADMDYPTAIEMVKLSKTQPLIFRCFDNNDAEELMRLLKDYKCTIL